MSSLFDKISDKTDAIAEKQRKSLEESKAKIKASSGKVFGTGKTSSKTKKAQPKSKVARGMEVMCVLIAVLFALAVVNLNIWPFNLVNGGEQELSSKSKVLTFFVVAIPVFILGILITRPIIKRLEKKYGKQAW